MKQRLLGSLFIFTLALLAAGTVGLNLFGEPPPVNVPAPAILPPPPAPISGPVVNPALPVPINDGDIILPPVNGTTNAGDGQAHRTKSGKMAWSVKIGPQPLATPAIVDGKLFVGGGFGSYEFYCYDARSGKKLWMHKTTDDGPTAAVVAEGYVAFNTESCEIEIITMEGKKVWKKWLGDPLMSMPAIADGKIYMAYPDSKGDHKHYLACFELRTGKDVWKKTIPGEIVTAPVISKGHVFLTTLEGTVSCYEKDNGKFVFADKRDATSSPMAWNGKLYYSQREIKQVNSDRQVAKLPQQQEKIVALPVAPAPKGSPAPAPVAIKGTLQDADYLDIGKRKASSGYYKANEKNDAAVGFALKPGDAKLQQAETNLGIGNVAEVWAFQGSRPFVHKNRLYSTMGDTIKCVDLQSQDVVWTKKLTHKGANGALVDSVVTPPAIANGKLFVGTHDGDVVCLDAASGKVLWTEPIGQKIVFQPAVAHGIVYVSTFTGYLYAIETGDRADDGWLMWGGNARHNGGID
jgi:outer membrane protein assembly factor BamB